jgi:glycosyltransferase involved in cell wall biosynthesis
MSTRTDAQAGRLRLLVTVTLNDNQLRAHLEPITDLDDVEQVTLVADVAPAPMDKLRTIVPPRWLVRVAGRAAAKLLTGLAVAVRERPQWVLGYKVMPHGVNALIIARFTRRRVLVHVIGGPVEWEGGGYRAENALLDRLPGPVPWLERFFVALLARCDAVAVMGSQARADLVRRGLDERRVVVVPASVDERRFAQGRASAIRYDLVTASQLSSRKRIGDFLLVVALLRMRRPEVRAAIAGRGPLEHVLRAEARRLGVADAVDFLGFVADVESLYAQSRLFMLTSDREGLSIALTEAMAAGLPALVTDVGEARDVLTPEVNGYLVAVGDVAALVEHATRLLDDDRLRARMSAAARSAALGWSGRRRVTAINRHIFELPPLAGRR